jgi:hypothetical protein
MSIFQTLFGQSNPAAQPAPGNTNSGAGNTPGASSNGVVPPDTNKSDTPNNEVKKDVTPLDTFSDIWKTPDNPNKQEDKALFADLDPVKVMESAKKVDFSKAVTPQQLESINKGGQEAVTAFAQAMNSVAQTVYAQNALATTKIVEQALSRSQAQYDTKIPEMVKKLSANERLVTENPMLSNPAIQPLVGALTEQLTRKNPSATANEIQQQVVDYFAALGTSFAPKPKETKESKAAAQSMDWSTFLQ